MATVCFIHGLNSSHFSFSYIADNLEVPLGKINYDSQQRLGGSILQVIKQLPSGPIILVGHSLGGVIAMNIAHMGVKDVQSVVTISSPLGGSKAAVYARWVVTGLPILSDITPGGQYIKYLRETDLPCPVLSICSTGGSLPTSTEPNDSVVTVASQKVLADAKKIEIKANHFEVLMHPKTVSALKTNLGL